MNVHDNFECECIRYSESIRMSQYCIKHNVSLLLQTLLLFVDEGREEMLRGMKESHTSVLTLRREILRLRLRYSCCFLLYQACCMCTSYTFLGAFEGLESNGANLLDLKIRMYNRSFKRIA